MFALIIFCAAIAVLVTWVKTLKEIVSHEFYGHNKIIWLGFVLFMPLLGMVFYYILGRNQMIGHSDGDYV